MNKIEVRKSFNKEDGLGRSEWNLHFMAMTYVVANRSFDTSTKCGCIATREKLILSSGFNGPPAGSKDYDIPIDVRPEKYWYMEHSERNAIYNAVKSGINLKGCTFYVTGVPCVDCMRGMLCIEPKEIIYLCANDTVMNHYKKEVGDVELWLDRIAPKTKVIEYRTKKCTQQIINYLDNIKTNTFIAIG